MGQLNWNELMTINVDEVVSQDVTDLYNALVEFEADNENDPAKLKKLFKVTQTVLTVKGMEAEQVMEQLAKEAAEEGRKAAQKNQEIENLKIENQTLRKKNRELEQRGGASVANWKDQNFRETIDELESQIAMLHRELKESTQKFGEMKETSDQYRIQVDEYERKVREMKIDNDQLREDLRDLQRQTDAQRESLLNRMDDDQQISEKLRSRNVLLSAALDENKRLLEYNTKLEEEIKRTNKELIDGKNEIDKTTDDYLKLKLLVDNNESEMDRYIKENTMMKLQIEELLAKLETKNSGEDELMLQVDEKVENWKLLLNERDERIRDLQQQVVKLKEEIFNKNFDVEKASVSSLSKIVKEKEEEIERLVERLSEAGVEMENHALFMEDVRSKILRGSGQDVKQNLEKLVKVQEMNLNEKDEMIDDFRKKVESAENDASSKDKQLNEILQKMTLYEQGIFGLPEAVTEIKQLEGKLSERERSIEELIQYANRCELQLNELYEEAEDLRERLGLDPKEPIFIEGSSHRRGLNILKDKSLNRVLQKEIERLEDERIELKKQIRDMSQSTGQRAVALGLSLEDSELVNSFIEKLKGKTDMREKLDLINSLAGKSNAPRKEKLKSDELEKNSKKMNILYEENVELKTKLSEFETENRLLEKGLKEIRELISSGEKGGAIHSNSIDRLIEMMDARSTLGRYDKSIILKAEVDNLTGRNEELRREVREVKLEAGQLMEALSKITVKNENLELELKSYKELGSESGFGRIPLPTGMSRSSADVINSLNEHLLVTLEELSLKEELLKRCGGAFEEFKRSYAVAIHKQGLLYEEINLSKKENEDEVKKLKIELKKKEEQIEIDAVKVQEYDRLVETLNKDENEIQQRLADASRRSVLLRTNEKVLSRKFSLLQDSEAAMRRENIRLKSESVDMEKKVIERIGYLQRAKDSATFKLSMVQKLLDNSVPAADLENASKQFSELTEKYRALLDSTNVLVQYKNENLNIQEELKILRRNNEEIKKELEINHEKLHTYEVAFHRFKLEDRGFKNSDDVLNSTKETRFVIDSADDKALIKRLTTLEMKELNERQKADHASAMYERQKEQLRMAEDRVSEMEAKFTQLTKMNLEAQKIERELRDELTNCVTKAASDIDRQKIIELESSQVNLILEISKLKEVSEIALMQVQSMESQQKSNEKEMQSLRQQLIDIQAQSDENTVIGKLHNQIVALQVSEGVALKKFEKMTKKAAIFEAKMFQSEQKLDEKDANLFHARKESSNRIRHLRMIVQEYRRRYAGSVPLLEQEKFTKLLTKLQNDKMEFEIELQQAREERRKLEEKLLEVEVKEESMKELVNTLRDAKGAQKVIEWNKKLQDSRVEAAKFKRENEKLKEKIDFIELSMKKLEVEIKFLEEDKFKLTQEFEESEIEWEHREVELERTIELLEQQISKLNKIKLSDVSETTPKTTLEIPVEQQSKLLNKEIERKNSQIKTENVFLHEKIDNLEIKLKEKEGELLRKDRIITDLRQRISTLFSSNANSALNRGSNNVGATINIRSVIEDDISSDDDKVKKISQYAIEALQARLDQKEETLANYRKLLEDSQTGLKETVTKYENEIKQLQQQLQSRNEASINEVKKVIYESINKPDRKIISDEQIRRVTELEELLTEQELMVCSLQDDLADARSEIQMWKNKLEESEKKSADDKEILRQQCQNEVDKLKNKNDDLEMFIEELKHEMQVLEKKNVKQKEDIKNLENTSQMLQTETVIVPLSQPTSMATGATKNPVTLMKRTIESLRHEIAIKDNKIKTLSKTLMDLRSDMSNQAGMEVRNNADRVADEVGVKKMVDSQMRDFQGKIEEMDGKIKKLKDDNKKLREKETQLSEDLEITKDTLERKDTLLKRCQVERDKLSFEVDELRQKVDRMSTMSKQRPETQGFYAELDELRRRNKILSEELEKVKFHPEKPYEQQQSPDKREAFARWEEEKRWKTKCDDLRQQLREKDVELTRLNSVASILKSASYREKENYEVLQRDIMSGKKRSSSSSTRKETPAQQRLADVQELKRQNKSLNEEANMLRQQLAFLNRDIEELKIQNDLLVRNSSSKEKSTNKKYSSTYSIGERGPEYKELLQREGQLKKQVIELSEKNLQLNFELEQAYRDLPRLKEKVEDQEKYIDLLKSEKKQREMISKSRESISSLGSQASSIKKIGESGRSPQELERIISVLKKVVEKTRTENEELKNNSNVERLKELQKENEALKKEIEVFKTRSTDDSQDAKITSKYEKLKKDLTKEIEHGKKIEAKLREAENLVKTREAELEEVKAKLESFKSRSPSNIRSYEKKIVTLETELEQKNEKIKDLENRLSR